MLKLYPAIQDLFPHGDSKWFAGISQNLLAILQFPFLQQSRSLSAGSVV